MSRPRASRRTDALSRERVVAAAVELLDAHGERALTVRALTEHLTTGRGAIYHHVSGMDDLLATATDQLVRAATARAREGEPAAVLRALGLAIFDLIAGHPWVGGQLARQPSQPAVLHIWTSIGVQLQRLGVTGPQRSDAGAALANYIFGSAAQFTAGAGRADSPAERQRYLDELAATWVESDGATDGGSDGVVPDAASELRRHDDRHQFAAGIEIFLLGIAART